MAQFSRTGKHENVVTMMTITHEVPHAHAIHRTTLCVFRPKVRRLNYIIVREMSDLEKPSTRLTKNNMQPFSAHISVG